MTSAHPDHPPEAATPEHPTTSPDASPTAGEVVALRAARRWRLAAVLASTVALLAVVGMVLALVLGPASDPGAGPVPTEEDDGEQAPAAGPALSWAPPELEDPETVEVTAENRALSLEPDQDYVVEMPEPVEVSGGVTINGGRNVVLVGGEIRITEEGERGPDARGLFLQDQTGTVHVEGLLITGPALAEGINLDQREGAVVQLQNIRVETVGEGPEEHHADVIQTWAGPSELRVDRLSGTTEYQGFFLLPMQFGDQEEPAGFDLRNIDLTGADEAGYLLWRDDRDWPITLENVWVSPSDGGDDRDAVLWEDDGRDGPWAGVEVGTPPEGPFVPEGVAGTGYVSPGYTDEQES
ncbi:hypothetical protein [Actinotalea sp. C106]|uniref:hypothetical protein n=1 Tax=Actinotalea sp. C106 TaxID=2908644 RepID=UPI0020294CE1|nr:hypothetical protein [Actinotalea sp. C106]